MVVSVAKMFSFAANEALQAFKYSKMKLWTNLDIEEIEKEKYQPK